MLALTAICQLGFAQDKMPREDVVEVPAIGEGLFVHNLFQTNMVLQRDKPVGVWGWATSGEKVTVKFCGQSHETTAGEDRSWRVELTAMPANVSPQQLSVQGKDKTITLGNILVGDVWILGGQSNMEFPLEKVEDGFLEIVSANYNGIRILTVPGQNGPDEKKSFERLHEWSDWSSRHFRKGDWDVCSPEIVRQLSAIGYVFARRLHMAAQVPIGVVDASRGGTTVETWTPVSVLREIKTPEVSGLLTRWDEKVAAFDSKADLENRIKKHNDWVVNMKKQGKEIPANKTVPTDLLPGPAMDQNRPGNCYASMISPIAGMAVKGAIFHQGFNNALGAGSEGTAMYYQVFGPMITAWRAAFNDPEMPFGIISLCTSGAPQSHDDYLEKMVNDGIYIREVQYQTFLDFYNDGDKNIGFASSFDQPRSWYHPQLKVPVGERISRWALATQYGFEKEVKWKPPFCTEMKAEDGMILLRMDTGVKAIDDGPIVGFAIAGEDRRFQPAAAEHLITGKDQRGLTKIDRNAVVLTSPHVSHPVHFRYAWGRTPMGNLKSADKSALPFATQRSDDWKMEEVPRVFAGNDSMSSRDLARKHKGEAQKALRLDDLERRLKDAQLFIEENQSQYEKQRAAEKAAIKKAAEAAK